MSTQKKAWQPIVSIHMNGAVLPVLCQMLLTTKHGAIETAKYFAEDMRDDLVNAFGTTQFKLSTSTVEATDLSANAIWNFE